MKRTRMTCLAAVLAFTVAAGCATPTATARRTSTTVRTDPRPPEDTNLIMPPVPAPESAGIPLPRRNDVD